MYFNKKNFFSTIIITLFLFFLLKYELLIFYVPPIKDSMGNVVKFGDWSVVIDLAKCYQSGIDVFNANECDVTGRPHVYGTILLYISYVQNFYNFYNNIIPLIIVFFFILVINLFFNPNSIRDYILMIGVIFSTSFILAIERLNFEVVVFFLLLLLALLNKSIVQKIIILILPLVKFYPVTLGLFFLKKKLI